MRPGAGEIEVPRQLGHHPARGSERLLSALGEQLAAAGQRYELVVIGGSGLLALGIIELAHLGVRDADLGG